MRRLWRRTRPDLITISGSELSFLSSVVGVFLWPLVSSHSIGSWLKPVLQKLDFGVGEFLQKVKENHGNGGPPQPCACTRTVLTAVVCLSERRLSQAQRDQENQDSDLSSMFPKVSKGRRQQTGGTCLPLVAVGGFFPFNLWCFLCPSCSWTLLCVRTCLFQTQTRPRGQTPGPSTCPRDTRRRRKTPRVRLMTSVWFRWLLFPRGDRWILK